MDSHKLTIDIKEKIEDSLRSIGIMYRIFSREKSEQSLQKKIKRDSNYGVTKKVQDFIGIRIITYFPDDISIIHEVISSIFIELHKDNSIDEFNKTEFRPYRYNIIYKSPHTIDKPIDLSKIIDDTFEIQIRTVLSEGWHEVEHDLRYKRKSDWESLDNHSRKLNGVYATLETSEWTMLKIFEDLSYSHYKRCNWDAMLRHKFRLKIDESDLSAEIKHAFNNDNSLAKKFFRIDRKNLINSLRNSNFFLPLTLNNIIFFYNIIDIKDESIMMLTPQIFIEEFS